MLASLVLAIIAHDVYQGPRDFQRLKAAVEPSERLRIYRKWTWQSLELYGAGSLLALWVLGRLGALGTMPAEFDPVSEAIAPGRNGYLLGVLLAAMATGLVVPIALSLIATRRAIRLKQPTPPSMDLGDFAALMPRDAAERRWAFAVSLTAGVTEELFFRLLLPLILCAIFGNAWVAFAASALLFGAAHSYQGMAGVLGTGMVALVMSAIYLASGQLWLAMAVHVLVDVNTLLVRPAVLRLAERTGAPR